MTNSYTAKVTGGNIRNNHIYFPLEFFPSDTIGGSNTAAAAAKKITVTFEPGETVETDVDGTKRILRERGAVGGFFERAGIVEGDSVVLTRRSPYEYTISKTSTT